MIPRPWYRAEKPPEARKPEKNTKNLRNLPPCVGPENTKHKNYENGPKTTVLVFFCVCRIFGARPGGSRNFFEFFSYFRA